MSPRPDRRAERIPAILQAARDVFARSGFAEARMEDIARAAGLSKAAVYLYFASKDEVIAALLEQYFADAFADLAALRGDAGTLRDRLGGWAQQRITELVRDAAFLGIGYEFFAVSARRPEVRDVLRRYYRGYTAELTRLIEEAAARGERQPVNGPELATALVALFEGLTMLWLVDPDAVDLRATTAHALDRLLGAPG